MHVNHKYIFRLNVVAMSPYCKFFIAVNGYKISLVPAGLFPCYIPSTIKTEQDFELISRLTHLLYGSVHR